MVNTESETWEASTAWIFPSNLIDEEMEITVLRKIIEVVLPLEVVGRKIDIQDTVKTLAYWYTKVNYSVGVILGREVQEVTVNVFEKEMENKQTQY